MTSLGQLTFDLALNASGFAAKLASAGRDVARFAEHNTRSFDGSNRKFQEYHRTLAKLRQAHRTQGADIHTLTQAQQAQVQVVQQLERAQEQATRELERSAQITAQAEDRFSKYRVAAHQAEAVIQRLKQKMADLSGPQGLRTRFDQASEDTKKWGQAAKKSREQWELAFRAGDTVHAEALSQAAKQQRALYDQARAERDRLAAELAAMEQRYQRQIQLATAVQRRMETAADDQGQTVTAARGHQTAAEGRLHQVTTDLTQRKHALEELNKTLADVTERQTATAAAMADLEATARQVPTSLQRVGDTTHTALQQIATATTVIARSWTEVHTRMELVGKGQVLSAINTKLEPIERNLERISRGFRGVGAAVIQAQEAVYKGRDAVANLEQRLKVAQETHERYAQAVNIAQSNVVNNDAIIAERQAAIEEKRHDVSIARQRADELAAAGFMAEAAKYEAQARKHEASIEHLTTSIARQRQIQEDHRLSVRENTQQLHHHRLAVAKITDALAQQRMALQKAEDQLHKAKDVEAAATQGKKKTVEAMQAQLATLRAHQGPFASFVRGFLQLLGVQPQVIAGTKSTADELDRVGRNLDRAQSRSWLSWLGLANQQTQRLTETMHGQTRQLGQLKESWNGFAHFARTVVVEVLARLSADLITNAFTNMQQVVQGGRAQVEAFEQVRFSVNAMLAKEHRELSNANLPFVEAMQATEQQTTALIGRFEELAIRSTYTSGELINTFSTLKTGFTAAEAEYILGVLSQYGDVMQKASYELDGIGAVLVQIRNNAKLSTEDMKQLQVTYGISVMKYLADAYGKTTAEIQELITAGKLLSEDVIPIIVEGIAKDFAGAGVAAGETFGGLTSSLRDLGERTLRNMLTPALEELKQPLAGLIRILQNPLVLESIEAIGVALGRTVGDALDTLAQRIPDVPMLVEELIGTIGDQLGGLQGIADEVWEWGGLILDAFIDGMMAKVTAIQHVAEWIGDELAAWMEPHSPPKMAPDLDEWGKQTAQVYYDAMGAADPGPLLQQAGQQWRAGGAGPAPQGQAAGPLDVTNGILSYIAQLMEQLVSAATGRGGDSAARAARAPRDRAGRAHAAPPEPGETSEAYRQRIETMLAGSAAAASASDAASSASDAASSASDAASSKAERAADQLFQAEIRHLKATGQREQALVKLRERLGQLAEGSQEYLDIQTDIAVLEQQLAKERERAATRAEKAETAHGRRNANELKRRAAEQRAQEEAHIKYLLSVGKEDEAIALLEQRLARVAKNSKEYYDTLARLEKLQKPTADSAPAGPKHRLPVASASQTPAAPETVPNRLTQVMATIRQHMTAYREAVRTQLQPITDWIIKNQQLIGWALTGIASRFIGIFVTTKVIPILRELAVVLGMGLYALRQWLTPLGLLKAAMTVMTVAWLKNLGGFRDMTAAVLKDIAPALHHLQTLFQSIFAAGQRGGIMGIIDAFFASLPAIQENLRAVFTRIAAGFTGWVDPLLAGMQQNVTALLDRLSLSIRQHGGGQLIASLEQIVADMQNWLRGQKPETFVVGVLARLTTMVMTTTTALTTLVIGTVTSLITAYGPRLQTACARLTRFLYTWIQDGLPMIVRGLSLFATTMVLGMTSAGIELVRTVGKLVLQVAGALLPITPKFLVIISDTIAATIAWLLGAGIPQFVAAAADLTATLVTTLGQQLPMFTYNLASSIGQAIISLGAAIAGPVIAAILSAPIWVPKVWSFVTDTLGPALLTALIGVAKSVVGAFAGFLVGLVSPLAHAIQLVLAPAKLAPWLRSIGQEMAAQLVEGMAAQVPPAMRWFVQAFEHATRALQTFLGVEQLLMSDSERLAAQIHGVRYGLAALHPVVKGVIGVFGTLAAGIAATRAANAFMAAHIAGDLVGSIRLWADVTRIRLLSALGLHAASAVTANAAVGVLSTGMRTYTYTGLAGAIVQTRTFVVTTAVNAVNAIRSFIAVLLTGSIPAIKAYIASMVAASGATAATGASLLGILGPLALVAAAIGGVVLKWQDVQRQVRENAQELLDADGRYQRATRTLQLYADATDAVRDATYQQAQALTDKRKQLEEDTQRYVEHAKKLAGWGIFSGIDARRLEEDRQALNNLINEVDRDAAALDKAIRDNDRSYYIASTSADRYAKSLSDLGWQTAWTKEDMEKMSDEIQRARDEAITAMEALTRIELDYQRQREQSYHDHEARITRLQEEAEQERQRNVRDQTQAGADLQKVRAALKANGEQMAKLQLELAAETDAMRREQLTAQLTFELDQLDQNKRREAELIQQYEDARTRVEQEAHKERLKEEEATYAEQEKQRALAYIKERRDARRRLGQLLLDSVNARAALLGPKISDTQRQRIAELTDRITQDYGIEQDVSAVALVEAQRAMERYVEQGIGDLDAITAKIEEENKKIRETQELYDRLTEERVARIITEYDGRSVEELQAALDKVPEEVQVIVKARLHDETGLLTPGKKPQVTLPPVVQAVVNTFQPKAPATKPNSPAARPGGGPIRPPQPIGPRAKGGDVQRGGLYEVIEEGPELLTFGRRTFLMMGQQSGFVTPITPLGNAPGRMDDLAALTARRLRGLEPASHRPGSLDAGTRERGMHVTIPITISGNTVRSEADLLALEERVSEKMIALLDRVVLKGTRL